MESIPSDIVLHEKTRAFLERNHTLFIGGEWLEPRSNRYFGTENPANGKELAQVALADEADVDLAVAAARKAFRQTWREEITPAMRSDLLYQLALLMERDRQVLMELETLENGKPLENAAYDVDSAISHFKYYAGWPTKFEGSGIPVDNQHMVYTRREPLGVVGLIVPWNFPLMIAVWKLAPALAAGNCCVLKPAEQTSLTALYLAELIKESGFPDGVYNVVTGPGFPTGEALTSHHGVDKISFTGSTPVGKEIMKTAAASNLKDVSLELGGKSANVIFADADMSKLSESLTWSSFYNTGQECTLGSRIFVHKSRYEEVVDMLSKGAGALKIGDGFHDSDLGPMISRQQQERVLNYIEQGIKQGGELIFDSKVSVPDEGYFMTPKVFVGVGDEQVLNREEIFGPVVTISSFEDNAEVLERANASEYALAAGVWTRDISLAHRFASELEAGTVWINGYDRFNAAVPFGGFKQSGIGKEMGRSAMHLYTREKAIWVAL
ncbi:aldehyde dehydrogenase family protein [Robertkochia aurantiaca]|uniref:aldehyde dehydrogenase family protein n=1 Tax=Robertkochia aurantiaca TaxID=2873700 RepID=UPI001CC9F530|nr:aldehyde dehydrogenase family protein [Robertkochia sp. 3YJGBD-33]